METITLSDKAQAEMNKIMASTVRRRTITVLVTGGLEFEEAVKEGMPGWLCWNTTRTHYIGNTIQKYKNRLKHNLVPFSTYKKDVWF